MNIEEQIKEIKGIVDTMKKAQVYIEHQIEEFQKGLHVKGCECDNCSEYRTTKKVNSTPKKLSLQKNLSPKLSADDLNTVTAQNFANLTQALLSDMSSQIDDVSTLQQSFNDSCNQNDDSRNNSVLEEANKDLNDLKMRSDRKQNIRRSKYLDSAVKSKLVEYALKHGPTEAAKTFNVPVSVASYHFRRAKRGSPVTDQSDADISACLRKTLRGRGRGRPKLIGDDLDALLVDEMVKFKRDHNTNLNVNSTLTIAKDFIRANRPGLLEEDGGSVNLKLTWAGKLLARVNEREAELMSLIENGNGDRPSNRSIEQELTMSPNAFLQALAAMPNIQNDAENEMPASSTNFAKSNNVDMNVFLSLLGLSTDAATSITE